MSNEFDKEVAAKIADRAIAEAKKESEEKYGKSLVEEHVINYEDIKSNNISSGGDTFEWNIIKPRVSSNDTLKWEYIPNTWVAEVKEKEELSKIDFYRQKVQQYEAVENLMESIKCELEDVIHAREELKPKAMTNDEATIYLTYGNMESTYNNCLEILRELLKDI